MNKLCPPEAMRSQCPGGKCRSSPTLAGYLKTCCHRRSTVTISLRCAMSDCGHLKLNRRVGLFMVPIGHRAAQRSSNSGATMATFIKLFVFNWKRIYIGPSGYGR